MFTYKTKFTFTFITDYYLLSCTGPSSSWRRQYIKIPSSTTLNLIHIFLINLMFPGYIRVSILSKHWQYKHWYQLHFDFSSHFPYFPFVFDKSPQGILLTNPPFSPIVYSKTKFSQHSSSKCSFSRFRLSVLCGFENWKINNLLTNTNYHRSQTASAKFNRLTWWTNHVTFPIFYLIFIYRDKGCPCM